MIYLSWKLTFAGVGSKVNLLALSEISERMWSISPQPSLSVTKDKRLSLTERAEYAEKRRFLLSFGEIGDPG